MAEQGASLNSGSYADESHDVILHYANHLSVKLFELKHDETHFVNNVEQVCVSTERSIGAHNENAVQESHHVNYRRGKQLRHDCTAGFRIQANALDLNSLRPASLQKLSSRLKHSTTLR